MEECLELLQEGRAHGGGALVAAAGRRVETAERSGGKGTVGVVETGWLFV